MSNPILKLRAVSKISHNFKLINVSFDLFSNDRLAVLGASGSGKTTLAKIIKGYTDHFEGSIHYMDKLMNANNLLSNSEIQLVFQNAYDSLSPKLKVAEMIIEPLKKYLKLSSTKAIASAESFCLELGIKPHLLQKYPYQLSGGERQRVALLRALLIRPKVLICDEILSSLDQPLQEQILEILKVYQKRYSIGIIFITHDLPLVNSFCNKLVVIENGLASPTLDTSEAFNNPTYPFLQSSVDALNWLKT